MLEHQNATFAVFRTQDEIKIAVRALKRFGFLPSDLVIWQSRPDAAQDFQQQPMYQIRNGSIIGAIAGAVILGGMYFMLKSDLVHQDIWMGLGAILLGGIFGAASGALIGIGTPQSAANRYGIYLNDGGILLSVRSRTPDEVDKAREVLTATRGQDVHVADEEQTWNEAHLERLELEKFE